MLFLAVCAERLSMKRQTLSSPLLSFKPLSHYSNFFALTDLWKIW